MSKKEMDRAYHQRIVAENGELKDKIEDLNFNAQQIVHKLLGRNEVSVDYNLTNDDFVDANNMIETMKKTIADFKKIAVDPGLKRVDREALTSNIIHAMENAGCEHLFSPHMHSWKCDKCGVINHND